MKPIYNGDHAEFEREHANTPPHERPDWPLPSFDARDWAKAFCQRFMILDRDEYDPKPVEDNEGLMIAWFANALMRGFDEHATRTAALACGWLQIVERWERADHIQLHAGEMTRQELRSVKTVVAAIKRELIASASEDDDDPLPLPADGCLVLP